MTDTSATRHTILHIALPDDWSAAQHSGSYAISTRGRSLGDEGFIHCSHPHQVEAVANNFYGDLERLVLLTIDVDQLDADVVEEPPFEGSPDRFPHIYGAIPLAAVIDVDDWARQPGAPWVLATDR